TQHLVTSFLLTVSTSSEIFTKACLEPIRRTASQPVPCCPARPSCGRAPESIHGTGCIQPLTSCRSGRGCSSLGTSRAARPKGSGARMCVLITEQGGYNPGNVRTLAEQEARVVCCRNWVRARRQSNMQMYRAETVLPLFVRQFAKCRPCAGMPWHR
ncbi:hypothetical protein B0H11DRAFT_2040795, partial [Mycena galericulata]